MSLRKSKKYDEYIKRIKEVIDYKSLVEYGKINQISLKALCEDINTCVEMKYGEEINIYRHTGEKLILN